MRALISEVHERLQKICGAQLERGDWAPTPKRELGDVAIPCFKLAKTLGKAPPAIAQELAPKLLAEVAADKESLIGNVKAVGPYLNIFFRPERMLAEQLAALDTPEHFGGSATGNGQTALVEFSSPNVAKEIGLHHIRSTAIGNAVANLFALHGYKVIRINYLGDWGTTFGKHLVAQRLWGSEERLRTEGLPYMLANYVRFNREAKEKPELEEQARNAFRVLESGDVESVRLWKLFREISIAEFKSVYERMGLRFDYYDGEAMYGDKLEPVVAEIDNKIGTKLSEGALICELPGHKVPVLLKKSDGASLYITRDLAAVEDRWHRFKFDLALYVVAVQQKLHFQQMIDTLKGLGKDYAGRVEHVDFGMLSFGAKTMKTREGNILILSDVFDEGKRRALEVIQQKNPDLKNAEETADMIGLGALLFSDLCTLRTRDIKFEWEQALSFEGDTGPFLQYTHARCCSLLEKTRTHLETLPQKTDPAGYTKLLQESSVHKLLGDWAFFSTYSERALEGRDPSQIATALLNVAQSFNQLYHAIRFLDEKSRERLETLLALTEGTRKLLAHGLAILGIRAPQEM